MDKDFKGLVVWRASRELAGMVYRVTLSFPPQERYGLVDQMRRSSVSVASNIAEGHGRGTRRDFAHFLTYSSGSLSELETQALIASDIGYLPTENLQELTIKIQAIRNMIRNLRSHLLSNPSDGFEIREDTPPPYGDNLDSLPNDFFDLS